MGIRFQRRIRIAPGLRLNLSRSGVSASVGRRGAWLTFGRRGTRTTVGLPGTGLSYTSKTQPTKESLGWPIWLLVVLVVAVLVGLLAR
jgi:hypothetical protein